MSEPGALINVGELAKPATVLVEKVCNAVGIVCEPTRIRRKARAEADATRIAAQATADAAKITALAQIELKDIERRALERFVHQEARKQENIESITAQAAQQLPLDAKVEDLSEDWVAHFFKQCDTVSDKEMQSLWARVLAGEASAPGRFSRRTVDFISTIDKHDAALFTSFCQFICQIGEPVPLIFDLAASVYTDEGITFDVLKHLDSIGLISLECLGSYWVELPPTSMIVYHGRAIEILAKPESGHLDAGHALLTSVGKQLSSIAGARENPNFFEYVRCNLYEARLSPRMIGC